MFLLTLTPILINCIENPFICRIINELIIPLIHSTDTYHMSYVAGFCKIISGRFYRLNKNKAQKVK